MSTGPITTAQKVRALPWYYSGQGANVVFILLTWFGPILLLFLNALGFSKTRIGFIVAMPFLMTPAALLISRRMGSWGVKATFLWGQGLRTLITAGLCFAPAVLRWAGASWAFAWVAAVATGFALCRVASETGFLPWSMEFIPNAVRGRTDAICAIVVGLVSVSVSLLAAAVLKLFTGVQGYLLLILWSLPFGLMATLAFNMIPGGAPSRNAEPERRFFRDCLQVLRDRNFLTFELGMGCYLLFTSSLSFLPLYVEGRIGLGADKILLLSACYWCGLMASSYLWGWSGDRFGSKPVLFTGLVLACLMPVWMFAMPRGSAWSLRAAMAIYAYYGFAVQGVVAGSNRYFYVGLLPPETTNLEYYSLHYAWSGLATAAGPLLGGLLLDRFQHWNDAARAYSLDQFTPLFGFSLAMSLAAMVILRRLRKDGLMHPGEFMALFFQGNPLMAFNSMIRYRLADAEPARLSMTRRMGDAENPMNTEELLEAIADPSFNVRYEAILAMARLPPDPRLIAALAAVLDSKEPDLSVAAGWALGRIGDRRALPALRRALSSEYALLRSRSARSLANLGDQEAVPLLLARFRTEPQDRVCVAYAAALGVFRVREALDGLLGLLERLDLDTLRGEAALAVARLLGGEQYYVRLWRAARSDPGTALAEAVRRLRRRRELDPAVAAELSAAEQAFARHDLGSGSAALARAIGRRPPGPLGAAPQAVLAACGRWLAGAGPARVDNLLLAMLGLHAAGLGGRRQDAAGEPNPAAAEKESDGDRNANASGKE